MKSLRPFIILASLFFLLVEIYEPSTSFVRATVVEQSATSAGYSKAPTTARFHAELATSPDPASVLVQAPDVAVSHSSTLFVMLLFNVSIFTITTKEPDYFLKHEGIHFILKRPPIAA